MPSEKERLEKSLDKLFKIYKDISTKADEVNQYRCPYKNAKNICTATFKCLNQHFIEDNANEPICTGSEKLDYRPACITDQPIKSNDEQ